METPFKKMVIQNILNHLSCIYAVLDNREPIELQFSIDSILKVNTEIKEH